MTVIAAIFVFGLLVFVHELGHFITAKMTGMRVDEFAIGFGPKIISKKYGETIYSLRIIPLGGFNKIAGMEKDIEGEEPAGERSFYARPIWARMLVIVSGSAMNLILPIVLLFLVFVVGGIEKPVNIPVIGEVVPNKPAAAAQMMKNDIIVSVDGQHVDTWQEFVNIVRESAGKNLQVVVERQDVGEKTLIMMPEYDEKMHYAVIGVIAKGELYRPGVLESAGLAVKQTFFIANMMLVGIYQMVTGTAAADVAGPIGVMQMAGEVARHGFLPLLQFAALLSINLGLINLLPIPVLDGGYIVALAIEGVRGKPLGEKNMRFVQMIGFALLIMLMLFATFKDFVRLNIFG